jgi:hypothetical protein
VGLDAHAGSAATSCPSTRCGWCSRSATGPARRVARGVAAVRDLGVEREIAGCRHSGRRSIPSRGAAPRPSIGNAVASVARSLRALGRTIAILDAASRPSQRRTRLQGRARRAASAPLFVACVASTGRGWRNGHTCCCQHHFLGDHGWERQRRVGRREWSGPHPAAESGFALCCKLIPRRVGSSSPRSNPVVSLVGQGGERADGRCQT